MNDYCYVDSDGICKGVFHTIDDFQQEGFCIASGADQSWVGTKRLADGVWHEYVAPVRVLSKFQFMSRFTPEERVAILTTSKTDVTVEAYQQLASLADEVDLDHESTISGLDLLVAKGLITEARKLEILA